MGVRQWLNKGFFQCRDLSSKPFPDQQPASTDLEFAALDLRCSANKILMQNQNVSFKALVMHLKPLEL